MFDVQAFFFLFTELYRKREFYWSYSDYFQIALVIKFTKWLSYFYRLCYLCYELFRKGKSDQKSALLASVLVFAGS